MKQSVSNGVETNYEIALLIMPYMEYPLLGISDFLRKDYLLPSAPHIILLRSVSKKI